MLWKKSSRSSTSTPHLGRLVIANTEPASAALALLAFVNGLALHAISAPGQLEPSDLVKALDTCVSELLSA